MDDLIRKELEQEDQTEFHKVLLQHCKDLVGMSRRRMSAHYPTWDAYDDVYQGIIKRNESDRAADKRGEPERTVVPLAYAQVQTLVAFCIAVYSQKERFFELVGFGQNDHAPAKAGEAMLARDLNYNNFDQKLYQFLLDVSRFGIAVFKTGWVRKMETVKKQVQTPPVAFMGMELKAGQTMEVETEEPVYVGNVIMNVSPFRFYPDPRLPLSRFQEGEFCASEDELSMTTLYEMERNGEVAGIAHVKKLSRDILEDSRRASTRTSANMPLDDAGLGLGGGQSCGMALLTECQVSLIPSKFEVDGKPIGPETWPVKWNVWYVNDDRIVKAEPLDYPHKMYTYDLAEFSPDQHHFINSGLSATIHELQSIISWLINSHITSVRKTITNWLVVDPAGIEMRDLADRKPVIRMKANVAMQGVDKFVKQLEIRDVTQNHVKDAEYLHKLIQVVTGISENVLGQFHGGRRTATENRNVNAAVAARLKLVASLVFKSALEPMGRKMLKNLQAFLDVDTYVRVFDDVTDPDVFGQFKSVNKGALEGQYDFEVFDGTLPSERGVQAMALQEMLLSYMQNPEAILSLGYDPRKLMAEWLELRGIKNPRRFLADELQLQLLIQNFVKLKGLLENGTGEGDGVPEEGAAVPGAAGGNAAGVAPGAGLGGPQIPGGATSGATGY